jgi:poly-gamma-glutamate synthesis protein (capsule biosynthesis protein)
VVFGHGPHRERGIEIYNGRPIFYALGNFVLHNDLIKSEPWDLYSRFGLGLEATTADIYDLRSANNTRGQAVDPIGWRTLIASVEFRARELREIRLHPLDLGFSTSKRSQRGRPVVAEGQIAEEILRRVQALCEPYATCVEIEDAQGVIRF